MAPPAGGARAVVAGHLLESNQAQCQPIDVDSASSQNASPTDLEAATQAPSSQGKVAPDKAPTKDGWASELDNVSVEVRVQCSHRHPPKSQDPVPRLFVFSAAPVQQGGALVPVEPPAAHFEDHGGSAQPPYEGAPAELDSEEEALAAKAVKAVRDAEEAEAVAEVVAFEKKQTSSGSGAVKAVVQRAADLPGDADAGAGASGDCGDSMNVDDGKEQEYVLQSDETDGMLELFQKELDRAPAAGQLAGAVDSEKAYHPAHPSPPPRSWVSYPCCRHSWRRSWRPRRRGARMSRPGTLAATRRRTTRCWSSAPTRASSSTRGRPWEA
eukprot:3722093-Pyramimonas_sp.AAC.1